jgi:hypothetical protein
MLPFSAGTLCEWVAGLEGVGAVGGRPLSGRLATRTDFGLAIGCVFGSLACVVAFIVLLAILA